MFFYASKVAHKLFLLKSVREIGILLVLVILTLFPASGCRKTPTMPETYPVHGKVIFPDGRPVSGGAVNFQPLTDTTIPTSGLIGTDGTFTLTSYRDGIRQPGVIAGPCRVIVTPSFDENQRMLFPVKIFAEPYTVKPGDNHFTLTVGK